MLKKKQVEGQYQTLIAENPDKKEELVKERDAKIARLLDKAEEDERKLFKIR